MRYLKIQFGFTLIELMIVVAIVGLLAAIAFPVYSDYSIRARVVESLSFAAIAKNNVFEMHADGNTASLSLGYSAGYSPPSPSRNFNSILIDPASGVITLVTTKAAGDGSITLGPTIAGRSLPDGTTRFRPETGAIAWRCAAATLDMASLAPNQQAGTLLARFAPSECR